MNRRKLLLTAVATPLLGVYNPAHAQSRPSMKTVWEVRGSEGMDAIAFLGVLSGRSIYLEHYAPDAELFVPRLSEGTQGLVQTLWVAADAEGFGILWVGVALCVSHAEASETLDDVLTAIASPEELIRPAMERGAYWNPDNWAWFAKHAADLTRVLGDMKTAGFSAFLAERNGSELTANINRLSSGLASYDVIRIDEKLTGRTFGSDIDVTLLRYSKPHGVKVAGQRFLQALDYDMATTVRTAAHELLHPPVPMDGAAAQSCLLTLARSEMLASVVSNHDPRWGYNSLQGLFNEDLCQALDQMASDSLGVSRNPADRWLLTDGGMHILAAGLYGLLRQDHWNRSGGSIETWLAGATASGRLEDASLRASAARILERSADRLWPIPSDA